MYWPIVSKRERHNPDCRGQCPTRSKTVQWPSFLRLASSCTVQVSVSVGDSMSFFFRRLPPMHRRKSGVMVRIDDAEADLQSALGDSAHNQ